MSSQPYRKKLNFSIYELSIKERFSLFEGRFAPFEYFLFPFLVELIRVETRDDAA
jgi:hypothetical protein